MVRLIDMMGHREGFGHVLAEGSRRAAHQLEAGVDYLTTVKGAELPGHMPQAKRSLGLIYAVNPFGADHRSSEHDPVEGAEPSPVVRERLRQIGADSSASPELNAGKVRFALKTQHFFSFTDSADLCQFVYAPGLTMYGPEEAVELVKAVTGWENFSMDELMTLGERRLNMLRVFNAREGLSRKDDKLPKKLFKPLSGTGPTTRVKLTPEELEQAQDLYYELSGWDKTAGNPTVETLDRLGLAWTI
jgi:aldehyde:ferredoxin oxidoreductase